MTEEKTLFVITVNNKPKYYKNTYEEAKEHCEKMVDIVKEKYFEDSINFYWREDKLVLTRTEKFFIFSYDTLCDTLEIFEVSDTL